MHHILLASDTDFEGWRTAARALLRADVAPADIAWDVEGRAAVLFAPTPLPQPDGDSAAVHVPAAFMNLARSAILNREPQRFALLYRLLWRLRAEPELMRLATDEDVMRIGSLARDVHRDEHKMQAFVRFREIGRERESRYVAWFEPAHYIVEATAPFFAQRFADMAWSILTPDRCAHWDGSHTVFTEGATKADAPAGDPLETVWRTYYASIFNPARLKVRAMKAEMPVKYWRNLPEASLIDPLIRKAGQRTQDMVAQPPTAPHGSPQRKEAVMDKVPATSDALAHLRHEVMACRACHLWQDATQTVFGEGPSHAPVMLVGEQPGDKEDLAGRPFVGPAGQMLDRALAEAGIDRDKVYVTNAVKHFKFVPRGKIRLHQKPNAGEIKACRPWYVRERALVKPTLVVALGATAAHCVFGKATPIGKSCGRLIDLDDGAQAIVTVHPSYLLRLPDDNEKAAQYAAFVADLKLVARALRQADAA
ncbi:UdgX family uracil-DNA binding protein [Bradyrhizobium sp. 2TAF24]|uniref:UdgX family uracil-DNA binding protein n=1 Tax=Bradyrhizobium sp. 2TAF24 TaxID=3233011 RepID=UPI003F90F096